MSTLKQARYLIVVVIYSTSLDECPTLVCLQGLNPGFQGNCHLYVHINGKRDFTPDIERMFNGRFASVTIQHDGYNRGIVYAYRQAILDLGKNVQWITLMDQDSIFDNRLFNAVEATIPSLSTNEVVLAPVVRENGNGVNVSPFRVFLGKALPFNSLIGYPVCINSMSTFRSDYLRRLAPYFHIDFFLDTFDCWICHHMHRQGMKVKVMLDIITGHELSLTRLRYGDIYRAREIMALVNAARISWTVLPVATARLFWRLSRASWQEKTMQYLNLIENYRKYKELKKELYE